MQHAPLAFPVRPSRDIEPPAVAGPRNLFSVRTKFAVALGLALAWLAFSVWASLPWLQDLGAVTHPGFALVALAFIAYLPGFMNAFLMVSLQFDRRPPRRRQAFYPGISLLIAAYQEEAAIARTLASIARANYPGEIEVLVLDDGSTDATADVAERAIGTLRFPNRTTVRILSLAANRGKAAALNRGLAEARHDLIVTLDGDSRLREDSLTKIVERLLSDPPGTQAVAGAVLVGNARASLMAGLQQWDYFHGIAAVKRMQSMYHGTLVAQGAFSIYRRAALQRVGGWPDCVGEDIVLTWALLGQGYRTGYAEDAIVWTNAPTSFRQFALQRKRWARGLVEAIRAHPGLLTEKRLSTMFIWWNWLFLPLDLVFTFLFIPGLLLAAFGHFWIAGPMTLLTLPLAGLWNIVIFRIQNRMLRREGIALDRNYGAFILYMLLYALVMQPVSLWGYASELAGLRKKWDTK